MDMMDDMALLREYAARHSETAFETLVARRVNLVYSAALRQGRDRQCLCLEYHWERAVKTGRGMGG